MTTRQAIDLFIADKRSAGQINSDRTEASYRHRLGQHAQDVGNRDPRKTGREDVKRTLARHGHPNTQRNVRAVLVSFYDWAMEEGLRETNPARQTRKPKARKPSVYRLTRDECTRLMAAAETHRERRVIHIGLHAGLRNAELRGLQRRHLERPGAIWVSADIGKGGRERYVPVLPALQPVIDQALATVQPKDFLIPARWPVGGNDNYGGWQDRAGVACSGAAVANLVARVGARAQISQRITTHALRHAFGDHVARYAGLRAAQAVLGHANVATTEGTYTGGVTLDELAVALEGFSYGPYGVANPPTEPPEARTGVEPVVSASGGSTGHQTGGPHADAPDGDARRTP